jgi:hypothetical protein
MAPTACFVKFVLLTVYTYSLSRSIGLFALASFATHKNSRNSCGCFRVRKRPFREKHASSPPKIAAGCFFPALCRNFLASFRGGSFFFFPVSFSLLPHPTPMLAARALCVLTPV